MEATVCLPQLDWMVRRRAMILPIPNECCMAIYLLSMRNGSPEITISGHLPPANSVEIEVFSV